MEEKKETSWAVVVIVLILFWPVGLYLLWKKINVNKKATMVGGKTISIIGWILIVLGALATAGSLDGSYSVAEIIVTFLILVGGGIGLVVLGHKTTRKAVKYRKYITLIVNQKESDINNIASTLNFSNDEVRRDLEKMIGKGFFQNAYIDERKGTIVFQDNDDVVNGDSSKTRSENRSEMKVVQCKNCSAVNKIAVGKVGECEYCGAVLSE